MLKVKNQINKYKYSIFSILWMVVVSLLSLLPGNDFPKMPDEFLFPHFDKLVHFGMYFIMTYLWLMAYTVYDLKYWQIVLIPFLFGLTMEISQGLFTTTRSCDILDLVVNTTGETIALIGFPFTKNLIKLRA